MKKSSSINFPFGSSLCPSNAEGQAGKLCFKEWPHEEVLFKNATNSQRCVKLYPAVTARAVAAPPQTPQLGGPTLPKGAPNCLEGPEVASIQKQSFAWRIALNGIFCAQILYFSILKFFAIVYFQIAS